MSEIAIRVENLSKLYRIGQREHYYTLRDTLVNAWRAPFRSLRANGGQGPSGSDSQFAVRNFHSDNYIWALKDVSFEVKRGEVMGIVGRNGAGKSTLLKILSRITKPTEGYAEVHGQVGTLLEVGTGFHPELTGRENIYLNGAVLGMKNAEIKQKFDEIVSFAEVERFIDTPVKHYSSGMYLRLAFAVAAHLEPEILLVDEVLAVGDATFQKKCLGKMDEVAKEGRTVLFISHNMAAVNRLCSHALLLSKGRVQMKGSAENTVAAYLSRGAETEADQGERRWENIGEAPGNEKIRLRAVRVCTEGGQVTSTIDILSGFWIEIEYDVFANLPPMRIVFNVTTAEGTTVFLSRDNYRNTWELNSRRMGKYVSRCHVPGELLNAGFYTLTVSGEIPFLTILFLERDVLRLFIERTGGMGAQYPEPWPGVICPPLQWEVKMKEGC